MNEENLNHFFDEFKTIRESKKLSIEDVAKATKLQKEYINALEYGNFNIASPVYIRLFIKSYCEYLNMDVDKTLKLYEEHISGKSKKKTSDETPKFIDEKNKDTNHKILDIESKISDNLNGTYFIEPKKIIALTATFLIVIISWIILARISTKTHENHKIKFDNTKLEWTFFQNLNLIDSQYVELKKINKKNVFKYEYLENKLSLSLLSLPPINVCLLNDLSF